MKTLKLTQKSLTKEGMLLTFEGGKKAYYTNQQVDMLIKLQAVPKAGDMLTCSDSVNPVTSEISDTWVTVGV